MPLTRGRRSAKLRAAIEKVSASKLNWTSVCEPHHEANIRIGSRMVLNGACGAKNLAAK